MSPATILLLIQLTEMVAEILNNAKLGKELTSEQVKKIEDRQSAAISAWKAAIGT